MAEVAIVMSRMIISLSLVLLCAACSESGGDVSVTEKAQPQSAPQAAPSGNGSEELRAFYAELPAKDLRFDFQFKPGSDSLVTSPSGVVRRGLSIKYRRPDGRDMRRSLDTALLAAGYKPSTKWQENDTGGSSRTFVKDSSAPLTLTLVPEATKVPEGGVIWIGWPAKHEGPSPDQGG